MQSAANDNPIEAPLSVSLAVIDTLECIWRCLHGDDRKTFAAHRDWRSIQRLRAETYRFWLRRRG